MFFFFFFFFKISDWNYKVLSAAYPDDRYEMLKKQKSHKKVTDVRLRNSPIDSFSFLSYVNLRHGTFSRACEKKQKGRIIV